jgi:hypothetical protein
MPKFLFGVLFLGILMVTRLALAADPEPGAWDAASSPAEPGRYAVGLGFPDLRARVTLLSRLDLELKAAAEADAQAFSVRAYFRALRWGRLSLEAGGELGYVRFVGVDNLDGDGYFTEPFLGLRFALDRHWSAAADLGPAFVNVSSGNESIGEWQWTANVAVYYTLF